MSTFKKENKHTLAYMDVLEHECKSFLLGACCAEHAWKAILILRQYRSQVKQPLMKIIEEGSRQLFTNCSREQIIMATGFVRGHIHESRMIDDKYRVKGQDVMALMIENDNDIDIVTGIVNNKRSRLFSDQAAQEISEMSLVNCPEPSIVQ